MSSMRNSNGAARVRSCKMRSRWGEKNQVTLFINYNDLLRRKKNSRLYILCSFGLTYLGQSLPYLQLQLDSILFNSTKKNLSLHSSSQRFCCTTDSSFLIESHMIQIRIKISKLIQRHKPQRKVVISIFKEESLSATHIGMK